MDTSEMNNMQTFITSLDMDETARNLDRQRLGKQRLEAIQILRVNLGLHDGWKHHPIVKMWKGYEPFLLKIYLKAMLKEWDRRGYINDVCQIRYNELLSIIGNASPVIPPWITEEFIRSHKSNLIRKFPEYYSRLFPNIPSDIPYIWE